MKQTMKTIILVMSLVSANTFVMAQNENEIRKELERNFELTNQKEQFATILTTILNAMAEQDTSIAALKINWNEVSKEVADSIYPAYKEYVKDIYRQNFTLEEIRQMNTYLASSVGQKVLRLTPWLMQAGMKFFENEKYMNTYKRVMIKSILNKSTELDK